MIMVIGILSWNDGGYGTLGIGGYSGPMCVEEYQGSRRN